MKDLLSIAKSSDEAAKSIAELSDEDLKFLILRMLNDKKLSSEPVAEGDLKKIYAKTISHYGL